MNLFSHVHSVVIHALAAMTAEGKLPRDLDFTRVSVEPPREAQHGDVATNAAMVLARPAGLAPRDIAAELVRHLSRHEDIARAEAAGPGFINMRLKASFWPKLLEAALTLGDDFGRSALGQGKRINVEFVSANPTGPLHVGHCRGAVFGDALANLLEATGSKVTREFYINDAGVQIEVLARSVFMRYREALGESIGDIAAGLYPGDYLKPVGAALAAEHGPGLLAME